MNVSIPSTAAAGRATGSTTFQYVRSVLQPSTRAASISSVGRAVTRYWRMKNTPNAVTAPGRISAWSWSTQPNHLAIIRYGGMMPSCVGTIIVATITASSAWRPRKRSLASANPARVAVSTIETVTVADTTNELNSALRMSTRSSMRRRLSSRWVPGTRSGGDLLIPAWSLDAATTDQYSGNSETSTTAPSST